MSVLVLLEQVDGEVTELSLQALAFARRYADGDAVVALAVGLEPRGVGGHGVETLYVADHDAFGSHAPACIAQCIVELCERLDSAAVVAAGDEVGNEVLAHVAAKLDLPFAANCVEAAPAGADSAAVTRVRWGGSLLEEAVLHAPTKLLTVQPHAVAAAAPGAGEPTVERFAPTLSEADLAVRVTGRVDATGGGISLADANVVVSGGRGVGSAEGFAVVEELAELLGAAVGCSRVVTSAGWRPHTDQVGQTGTKISPDLYIPCGISGATQHIAGCRGAKKILAINADPEAPIFASADYAVIGDLHEILPAISEAIRRARGT